MATAVVLSLPSGANPPAAVIVQPDGGWAWQIPLPEAIGRREAIQKMFGGASNGSPPVKVRFLKITIPPRYAVLFTFLLPYFWAIALATPWSRQSAAALAAGSVLLGALAVLLEIADVIHVLASYTQLISSGSAKFVLDVVHYFALEVIPYLAPPLLALCLLTELRRVILPSRVAAIGVLSSG